MPTANEFYDVHAPYDEMDFDVSDYEHTREDEGMPLHDDYGDRDDWY